MSECKLNKYGYTQVIEDEIDFLKRNISKEVKRHPYVKHIELVLRESIDLLYPDHDDKP